MEVPFRILHPQLLGTFMMALLSSFTPFMATLLGVATFLWGAYWLLIGRDAYLGNTRKLPRQLLMLGLSFVGLITCVLVLPIGESSRNQLISLIGILLSAVLAFSSTTVISNLMAGILMHITKPFHVGDFIRIGEHFGRVTEQGLFDTEIQTETRDLISLPNTYCFNNPVVSTRSRGTFVSVTLSLGYDVDRYRVEQLLIEAAKKCELQEPFVHILELGNFAVTYRISGLLDESKRMLTVKSHLYGCVLDSLHAHGIEIMSPSFMVQRPIDTNTKIIPAKVSSKPSNPSEHSSEGIAFDKAEQAEALEQEKRRLVKEIKSLEAKLKEVDHDEEKKALHETINQKKEQLLMLNHHDAQPDPGERRKTDRRATPR